MPFQRPNLPYAPITALPNGNRYQNLTESASPRPVPFQALDGDINYLVDILNNLQVQINGLVVGVLPGANNPLNANILVTTDGAGNISWITVGPVQITPASITQACMANSSIGTPQLQNACITTPQLSNLCVTQGILDLASVGTSQLIDANVTGAKLANQTILQANMANNSIGTAQIIPANVTGGNGVGSLAAQTIVAQNIANATITNAEIAPNTIQGGNIAPATISGANIANNTIASANMVAGTLVQANMAANSIGANQINGVFVQFNGLSGAGPVVPDFASANIVSVNKLAIGQWQVTFLNPGNVRFFMMAPNITFDTGPAVADSVFVGLTSFTVFIFGVGGAPANAMSITAGAIFLS